MKRIVLDTNVLVSGLISSKGSPGRILDAVRSGTIGLALDDRIYAEYQAVLARPYFADYFTASERERILDYIFHESEFVVCTQIIKHLPDLDDACFLEVAIETGFPLVTGNIKHFPKNKRAEATVLTPAEFLDILD